MVSREQVMAIAVLDALMLLAVVVLWRPLVATTFDEEFARLRGLPTLTIELGVSSRWLWPWCCWCRRSAWCW
jgi:ABC-type Mn2+/Zn2+ transport systems, permease components